MNFKHDERTREILSGQVKVAEIVVSRTVSKDRSRVIFKFPMGFEIHATKSGVAFAGSSTNFDHAGTTRVITVIRWANRIATEMKADRDIPFQDELIHERRLRTKKYADGWWAWWEGQWVTKVPGVSENAAVATLRRAGYDNKS